MPLDHAQSSKYWGLPKFFSWNKRNIGQFRPQLLAFHRNKIFGNFCPRLWQISLQQTEYICINLEQEWERERRRKMSMREPWRGFEKQKFFSWEMGNSLWWVQHFLLYSPSRTLPVYTSHRKEVGFRFPVQGQMESVGWTDLGGLTRLEV